MTCCMHRWPLPVLQCGVPAAHCVDCFACRHHETSSVKTLGSAQCQLAQTVHQSAAVLGLALVAMGEDLGRDMAHRSLEHLLQYGEPPVRCAPILVS